MCRLQHLIKKVSSVGSRGDLKEGIDTFRMGNVFFCVRVETRFNQIKMVKEALFLRLFILILNRARSFLI